MSYVHFDEEIDSPQARRKTDPIYEQEIQTGLDGLSSAEANRRMARDG